MNTLEHALQAEIQEWKCLAKFLPLEWQKRAEREIAKLEAMDICLRKVERSVMDSVAARWLMTDMLEVSIPTRPSDRVQHEDKR